MPSRTRGRHDAVGAPDEVMSRWRRGIYRFLAARRPVRPAPVARWRAWGGVPLRELDPGEWGPRPVARRVRKAGAPERERA
jgi:hypothetical protein